MAHVLTLYYHRLSENNYDFNMLAVSPERFRQQLLYLKKRYCIVRASEDWNTLKKDAVCITFDDGYLDNIENGMQILEELEIPITIFVTTGFMSDNSVPWWDELERCLLVGDIFPKEFSLEDREFSFSRLTTSKEKREDLYKSLHFLMKNFIDSERRIDWLRQLCRWRKIEPDKGKMIDEKACCIAANSNYIELGAHTITHPSLLSMDINLQENEMKDSKERLSQIINKDVTVFSYPFGQKDVDYSNQTVDISRKYFEKAFTTNRGIWKTGDSFYEIPRVVIRNWEIFSFADKIEEYWKK